MTGVVDHTVINLTVFVLAILVGFAVISKVPATLHTPLMSGANSIHGIVLVGSMFIAIEATDLASQLLSLIAVAFTACTVNLGVPPDAPAPHTPSAVAASHRRATAPPHRSTP